MIVQDAERTLLALTELVIKFAKSRGWLFCSGFNGAIERDARRPSS